LQLEPNEREEGALNLLLDIIETGEAATILLLDSKQTGDGVMGLLLHMMEGDTNLSVDTTDEGDMALLLELAEMGATL
jgi:hypothetical protein